MLVAKNKENSPLNRSCHIRKHMQKKSPLTTCLVKNLLLKITSISHESKKKAHNKDKHIFSRKILRAMFSEKSKISPPSHLNVTFSPRLRRELRIRERYSTRIIKPTITMFNAERNERAIPLLFLSLSGL